MPRRKPKTPGVKPSPDVEAAARALAALDLAIAGNDWQTVADQAGYASRGAAYNAVQRELKRRIDCRVDALRTLQLARLGRLRTVYYPKAMGGDGWSMDRVLRLDEREIALMGLDAVRDAAPALPTIIEVNATLAQAIRGQANQAMAADQAAVVQALERTERDDSDSE